MAQVLDATALLAYLGKESGSEKVTEILKASSSGGKHVWMSSINWGEVFYRLVNRNGMEGAENIQKIIENLPIEIVIPSLSLTQQAAVFKALNKLPYADCFAAALAKIHDAQLVTADSDFKLVENEIEIIWIR